MLGKTRLEKWIKQLEQSARVSGCIQGNNRKHKGKQTCYVQEIDAVDATYLKRLYRYATSLHGDVATFKELADAMNAKANVENVLPEHMKPMHLSQGQLKRWFKSKKGKLYSSKEKLFLSEEQKEARVRHAQRIQELKRRGAIVTYLDEKWFYTLSRHRCFKHLPREEFEPEGCEQFKVRKVISRQHGLKVMLIGVATEPNEEHEFDGKIVLERVVEEKQLQLVTYRKTFSHDRLINDEIKAGEWRALFPNDPTMIPGSDVLRLIVDYYNLDEDVEDYLCLRYKTYGGNGQDRIKILSEEETLEGKTLRQQDGIERALTL